MKVSMLSELHATLFICTAALADETWVCVVMCVLAVISGWHSVEMGAREADEERKIAEAAVAKYHPKEVAK